MAVKWHGKKIYDRVARASMIAVIEGAQMIEEEANRRIRTGSRTGRVYYKNGAFHQASAPGEPPAFWSGKLVVSSRVEADFVNITAKAIWDADHAVLELGTERIEPRPFIRPATQRMSRKIHAHVAAAVRRAIKGT